MDARVVYLMRGLPACGKSHTARGLAGESGVVLETDQYFYTMVGDDNSSYDYHDDLLPAAQQWNFQRFLDALRGNVSPIVVDRGNGLNAETQVYVRAAREQGYAVELREPESLWWQELRVLLKYKRYVDDRVLDHWADVLAEKSLGTHRVPAKTIRHWMSKWRHHLTVDEIANYRCATAEQQVSDEDAQRDLFFSQLDVGARER